MSGSKKLAGRPAVERLRQAVSRALRQAGLAAGDRLLVGCSYGPDSLALADCVLALRRPLRLGPVTLCYVDHGLRAEAAAEAAAVRALAEAAGGGVTADVRRVRVARRGRGLEDAAREARHQALAAAADAAGARFVLLAHTASDQAETVLHRILRGAGPAGLAGIPPRRGRILRPMLELSRADVEAYLAARRLRPAEDTSNRDPAFTRSRLRHTLLPALRAENPNIDAALARLAAAQRELLEALDQAAAQAAEAAAGPAGSLRVAPLRALAPSVAKRVVQRWLAASAIEPAASHLDAVLRLIHTPAGRARRLSLPGGIIRRTGDVLALTCHDPAVTTGLHGREGKK